MEKIRLHIDKVSAGMKLATAVTNAAGITLMPAGIRLTPMFINRLKKWNVQQLEVYAEPVQREGQTARTTRTATRPVLTVEQEEFARAVAVEVSRRFANVKEDPLMAELRNAAIKRLIIHGKDGMITHMRLASSRKGD